ncbi:hypothetical protein V8F20_003960 [Naviculisporaceae sp. PSN 640]
MPDTSSTFTALNSITDAQSPEIKMAETHTSEAFSVVSGPHTPCTPRPQQPNADIDPIEDLTDVENLTDVNDLGFNEDQARNRVRHYESPTFRAPPFGPWSPFSSPGPTRLPATSFDTEQDVNGPDAGHQSDSEHQPDAEGQDDQVEPNTQVAGAVATSTTATARNRNRNQNQETRNKAQKTLEGGHHHPNGPCEICRKANQMCIVNNNVSGGNTCVVCAVRKEKCSHQRKEEGRKIRREGRAMHQPCGNCTKKIKQGLPAECYQAGPRMEKKLGTACSQCMIDGTHKTCSAYIARPKSQKKTRS